MLKRFTLSLFIASLIVGMPAVTVHAGLVDWFSGLFQEEAPSGAPSQSFNRTILPEQDSTYDLGADDNRWANGYFDNFDTFNMVIGGASTGDLDMGGYQILNSGQITGTHFTATSTTADTNLHDTFYVDSSEGRVGIGTNSPDSILHLRGSVGSANPIRHTITNTNAGGYADMFLFNDDSLFVGFQLGGGSLAGTYAGIANADIAKLVSNAENFVIGTESAKPLSFMTNSAIQMVIDSDGNVGVGSTDPQKLFEISNTKNNATIRLTSETDDTSWDIGDEYGAIEFYSSDSSAGGPTVVGKLTAEVSGDPVGSNAEFGQRVGLGFYTYDADGEDALTQRMFLDKEGNLGVGTSTPDNLLDLYGANEALNIGTDTDVDTYIGFATDVSTGLGRSYIGYDSKSGNTAFQGGAGKGIEFNVNDGTFGSGTAMTIAPDGSVGIDSTLLFANTGNDRVGIGTNAPISKLDIVEDSADFFIRQGDGAYSFGLSSNSSGQGVFNLWDDNPDADRPDSLVQLTTLTGDDNWIDSGKLGIGTRSPDYRLTVSGDETFGSRPILGFVADAANQFESGRIRFNEQASNYQGAFMHYDGSTNLFNIGVHNLGDQTIANDLNVISIPRATGFVGIGTTSPASLLHIDSPSGGGDNPFRVSVGDSLGVFAQLANSDGEWDFGMNSTEHFVIRTGGTTLMQINNNAVEHTILVRSSSDVNFARDIEVNDNRYMLLGTGQDAGLVYDGTDLTLDSQLVGSGDFIINPNGGDVGIGTTTPAVALDVNGIIKTQERSSATCNALSEGGIYYDSDDSHFYGCDGTTWNQLDNSGSP